MKRRLRKTRRRGGGAAPTASQPGIWGAAVYKGGKRQMGGTIPTGTLPGIWGRMKPAKGQMGGAIPTGTLPGIWGRMKPAKGQMGGAIPTGTLPGIWGRMKPAKQMGGAIPTGTLPGIWGRMKPAKQMGGAIPTGTLPGIWGRMKPAKQMGGMSYIDRPSPKVELDRQRSKLDDIHNTIATIKKDIARGDTSPETQNRLDQAAVQENVVLSEINRLQEIIRVETEFNNMQSDLSGAYGPSSAVSTMTSTAVSTMTTSSVPQLEGTTGRVTFDASTAAASFDAANAAELARQKEEDARRMEAMMRPFDKGTLSDLSNLIGNTVAFLETYKLLNTSTSGAYTMYLMSMMQFDPSGQQPLFLIATQLPSITTLSSVMAANQGGPPTTSDKGTISKIADLPNNASLGDFYTLGNAAAVYMSGYWLFFMSPLNFRDMTLLSITDIAKLIGYPEPPILSAEERFMQRMEAMMTPLDKGSISNLASVVPNTGAMVESYKLLNTSTSGAYSMYLLSMMQGGEVPRLMLIATQLPIVEIGKVMAANKGAPPTSDKGSLSKIADLPNNGSLGDLYTLGNATAVYMSGYWLHFKSPFSATNAQVLGMADIARLVGYPEPTPTGGLTGPAGPTTTLAATTTAGPTTTLEPTTTVSLTGPVEPAPGPPVTSESIKGIVESAKNLFGGIASNPALADSLKDLIGRLQYLVKSPQLQKNMLTSINNLKKSAPAAAAVAEAFALLSLQFVKEPAILQILQALQSQYKNLMRPSLQNAVKDLISKLVPLLTPEVRAALNNEFDVFINASLKDSNIANTVGHIVEDSSKIVSSPPVQAAVDSVTV